MSTDDDEKSDKLDEGEEIEVPEEEERYLITDLKAYLGSTRFSDVTFIVGEKKEQIPAHCTLLACASPVLALMCYHNEGFKDKIKEDSEPLKIVLKDVDPVFFKLMLQVIYTDEAELTVENVGECMKLAQRYCVEKLQALCAEFLEGGVTLENAISMFENAPKLLGDPSFGLSFIEEKAKEIVAQTEFTTLSVDRLKVILASDNLKIKEVDLFKGCVAWAKAKMDKSSKTDETLKDVLAPIISLIRFPLFSVQEFATHVQTAGILSSEQMLSLYTYIACKESKSKNMPKVDFNTEKRSGAKGAFSFKLARCGSYGTLSEENCRLTSTSSSYCAAIADTGIEPNSGQHYWEWKINTVSSGSWNMSVGVATQSLNINSYLSESSYGWCYANHNRKAHASSSGETYGKTFQTGDTLGVFFDSDKGQVTFFHNKKSQGLGFSNIKQKVWPAVHVNSYGSLSLVKDAEVPDL